MRDGFYVAIGLGLTVVFRSDYLFCYGDEDRGTCQWVIFSQSE